jgi:diaminohydroxyphosphoribosylaminopyrimidine deaminase/5-amino-6-(5-phosphoribosylamino)uracil reductase
VTDHAVFMRRCLELAQRGQGHVSPNPMVGSVIVYEGKIVAEGWHQQYGGPHAEPNALAALPAGIPLKECTLYVNLEPCSHHGKTPPCAGLLVEKGIGKVVTGSGDPNPLVNGRGIQLLKDAGIAVETGVLQDACDELNRRFMVFHREKRPFIILKWACTADGFMAPENRERIQISGEEARVMLHRWRGEEDAVLIGANTAIMDNPLLDTRLYPGKNPLRVVLDPNLRASQLQGDLPTLVLNSLLDKKEGNCEWLKLPQGYAVADFLEKLYQKQIASVLVEGGPETLKRFMESGFADEIRIIRSKNVRIQKGIEAPKMNRVPKKTEETETDMIEFYGRKKA